MNKIEYNLADLVMRAKGERTLREFGEDTGVSYSNIQRILKQKYKPNPETIRKLTLEDKHPQGNVVYEDLMIAAGYMDGRFRDMQAEKYREQERQEEENKISFLKKTELIILGGLVQSGIRFQKEKTPKTYTGFSPDLSISVEDHTVSTWKFSFIERAAQPERRNGKIIIKELPVTYARRRLAETVLIAPDKSRKISVVTDFADYYAEMVRFKNNISYNGNLSIILIDSKSMTIKKEEYLSHYKNEEDELLICNVDMYTE